MGESRAVRNKEAWMKSKKCIIGVAEQEGGSHGQEFTLPEMEKFLELLGVRM